MTPDALRRLLAGIPSVPEWPPPEDPPRLLAAIEAACDRAPADRALAAALHAAHALATASDGVPLVIAGVRREAIVRWDAWTATWDGIDASSGRPARVRALRSGAARDPILRRALLREGRALRDALPVPVIVHETPWPALVAAIPGPPLSAGADAEDHERPEVLARMLVAALDGLRRCEERGFGLPELDRRELLDTPEGLRIACLTPAGGDAGPTNVQLSRIARVLSEWWGDGPPTAVDALLEGFQELPPRAVAEAEQVVRDALAEHLAGERHDLHLRSIRWRHGTRVSRLKDTVLRLSRAVPLPAGRGAVGVDLEGRTTLLVAREGHLLWGPEDSLVEIAAPGRDLDAREGRRMLRARAAAPPNPRLQVSVGGDEAFVEAACRWLSSAMALRTIRMLLEARP
jgi:hypothetical protein